MWEFKGAIVCLWVGLRKKCFCVDCYRMYTATVNHIQSLRSQICFNTHTHSSQYRDAGRTKNEKEQRQQLISHAKEVLAPVILDKRAISSSALTQALPCQTTSCVTEIVRLRGKVGLQRFGSNNFAFEYRIPHTIFIFLNPYFINMPMHQIIKEIQLLIPYCKESVRS